MKELNKNLNKSDVRRSFIFTYVDSQKAVEEFLKYYQAKEDADQ